jgi:hypothetical protein
MNFFQIAAVTLLGACTTPFQSNAQNLRLGLKAGVNMDKTQGSHLNDDFKGYFMGGAYLGLQFSKVRIQAEALFSQSQITTGDNFNDAFKQYIQDGKQDLKNGTFKMNELSIPLIIGFNLIPKFLWIEAGPQYTAVVSIQDENDLLKEPERVFKKGYVSGAAGVTMELPLNLNAGVRYIFGISDRNNSDVPDHWKTSHIQIHIGYSFMK